jgi:hypothetical protein
LTPLEILINNVVKIFIFGPISLALNNYIKLVTLQTCWMHLQFIVLVFQRVKDHTPKTF